MTMTLFLLLVVTATMRAAIHDDRGREADVAITESKDEQLLTAIERCVGHKASPDEIERNVGKSATINTLRKHHWSYLENANIEADPNMESDMPSLKAVQNVVYWIRPIDSEFPRLIGVAWMKDGSVQIFYGIVYPR
jgi:hypothetical protein